MTTILSNYINGQFESVTRPVKTKTITNPATLEVLGETPLCGAPEVEKAFTSAHNAFLKWRDVPAIDRVQPLFKLKHELEEHQEEIASILVKEHGKTFTEAMGDLRRGIQNVEVACGIPNMMLGECLEGVARNIDCTAMRQSIGVFAGITPFNFPAMVPFWFWPYAVASGNAYILKPSETVPMTQMKIFELIHQCGFPPGIINLVHGAKDVVDAILHHPRIAGVNFVGSTPVAQYIHQEGTKSGKRVQALGGAKNFMVVLPDADMDLTVSSVTDSCFGCAGERCLAGSVIITVGNAYQPVKDGIVKLIQNARLGDGLLPHTTMGPVISAEAKTRILNDIETAIKEGAELIVDGRNPKVGALKGHFIGPTVFDKVRPGTLLTTKEIFGPVIALVTLNTLDEAIELINQSQYANTTSLFTTNGGAARTFASRVQPSMVGINLGVPAPMAFFSFGGAKASFFGDIKAHGRASIEFFTDRKVTMARWPATWSAQSQNSSASPLWNTGKN